VTAVNQIEALRNLRFVQMSHPDAGFDAGVPSRDCRLTNQAGVRLVGHFLKEHARILQQDVAFRAEKTQPVFDSSV
jgi:hypothetical protein